MALKPPALRRGELIGVAAPGGVVEAAGLRDGMAEIERLGFAVRLGEGVFDRDSFTAGSLETRLAQLHGLFADPEVRAIACARGGAGTIHLLPFLDRGLVEANPKLVLGYSDITALHLWLGQLGLTSLHGPMVSFELARGAGAYDRASLWHGLTGEGEPWTSGSLDLASLRSGEGEGILRGGCLSLLAGSVGTPWGLRSAGEPTLLFIEDVDERPYRVDRMLRQLVVSGALAGVRGVVFGVMKGCDAVPDEGYTLPDVICAALAGMTIPVAMGLSSGHTTGPNVTLPLGVHARLVCNDGGAQLSIGEAAVR